MSIITNLSAYYKLDGNPYASWGTNNGTNNGGITYGPGKINQAGVFNGTNAYVSVPVSSDFTFGANDFGISVWVKRNSFGTRQIICGNSDAFGSDTSIPFLLQFTATNYVEATSFRLTTSYTTTDTTPITDTNWHHIVYTRSGDTFYLYVDNVLKSTISAVPGHSLNTPTTPFSIGRLGLVNNFYFNGTIDELGIWKQSLVPYVSDLYNAGVGISYPFASPGIGYINYLIVGGGGAGGNYGGGVGSGGGGGGGFLTGITPISGVGVYPVVVGAGGLMGAGLESFNGAPSSFNSITAAGGGKGGTYNYNTSNGASGGGGFGFSGNIGGTGVLGQGTNGALSTGAAPYNAAGGGGAALVGFVDSGGNGGNGGSGLSSSISGSLVYYSGGGGGGVRTTGTGGVGGIGGGGNGGMIGAGLFAQNGTPNTGGGGGGTSPSNYNSTSGNGGSGIVILSYPTGSLTATGGIVTTSGGNTIHTFLTSGNFTISGITYYFLNTGSTPWHNGLNWSATDGGAPVGSFPSSVSDDAYFTSLSGNCGLTAAAFCKNIIFSGIGAGNYANTFNLNTFNLNVKTGITLSATMTIPTTTGSLNIVGACALRSNGKQWNNPIDFASTSGGVIYNLLDNWTINGTMTISSTNFNKFNNNTLNINGDLNVNAQGASGTTNFVFGGSNTTSWNASVPSSGIYNNTNINKVGGTLNIGSVAYYVGTLTYTAGTVIHTGTLITSGGTTATFDTKGSSSSSATTTSSTGVNWNNVTLSGNSTLALVTLLSNFTVCGNLSIGNNGFMGSNLYLLGNLILVTSQGVSTNPTATIVIHGTGNQTWSHNYALRQPLTIDKPSGNFTLSGSLIYYHGTFTYITGNVVTLGSTVTVNTSTTFNTAGMSFDNITFLGGTCTINSLLQVNNTLTSGPNNNQVFDGTSGFTTNTLVANSSITRTITLNASNTYTVTGTLTFAGFSPTNKLNIVSSSGTTRAIFTLAGLATQSVTNTDAVRIDSSLGQTINCGLSAVLVDTLNWRVPFYSSNRNFLIMFDNL